MILLVNSPASTTGAAKAASQAMKALRANLAGAESDLSDFHELSKGFSPANPADAMTKLAFTNGIIHRRAGRADGIDLMAANVHPRRVAAVIAYDPIISPKKAAHKSAADASPLYS